MRKELEIRHDLLTETRFLGAFELLRHTLKNLYELYVSANIH